MLDEKTLTKNKKAQKLAKRVCFEVYKKLNDMPHVVWAEEFKTELGFGIKPSYD